VLPVGKDEQAALTAQIDQEWTEDVRELTSAFVNGSLSARTYLRGRELQIAPRDWERAKHPDALFLFETIADTFGPLAKYRGSTPFVEAPLFRAWLDQSFPSSGPRKPTRPLISWAKVERAYEKRLAEWDSKKAPTEQMDLKWLAKNFPGTTRQKFREDVRRPIYAKRWPMKPGPKGPRNAKAS
jgi:hypothetical protein